MKKLLGILSAIGLTAMAGTTVVACQVHNDFSTWTANEILGQVLIDGKHNPLDIDKKVDSNSTFDNLVENGIIKTELLDKLLPTVNHKKDDIANGLKISIGMTETEIENLPALITSWVTNGGVSLRYYENGQLASESYQGTKTILSEILEDSFHFAHQGRDQLPDDWNTLDENGVPHYTLVLFFDLNKVIENEDTLANAGNNQTGKVTAANYWTFKLDTVLENEDESYGK